MYVFLFWKSQYYCLNSEAFIFMCCILSRRWLVWRQELHTCLKYTQWMPRVKERPQMCLRLCVLNLCQVTMPLDCFKANPIILLLLFSNNQDKICHNSYMQVNEIYWFVLTFSKVQRRLYVVWMRRLEMFSCPLKLVRHLSSPSLFGQSPTKKSQNPRESPPLPSEERVLLYTVNAETYHYYNKHPDL